MNRLPNATLAAIEAGKITSYLLSDSHPAGRAKAAFFGRFGFRPSSPGTLRDALLAHARTGEVASTTATEFGLKFIVEGPLNAPDGRAPRIRSVWFVSTGEIAPRLVTAYPAQGGDE